MPTLKDVADRSQVSLLTAYRALSSAEAVDPQARQAVLAAAQAMGYRLNVTIRDVAHLAEVSIATVSYVLNNSQPVSAETRARVLGAATALGYRPNQIARNLQSSKAHLIGYAWHTQPGRINAILDRFTYCMAQAAESYGYHVLTFAQPSLDAVEPFTELMQTNRVDGFIIADTNRNDTRIRYLLDAGFPFAAFGRANERWDFAYVDVDGRRGIEMAVAHLLALGHTRIAALGWPEGSLSGDARVQGYFDAMDAAGITPLPSWIVRTTNSSTHAFQAARHLMSLSPGERPTAIVCLSDMMALGVMNYVHDTGLRIGHDVAVTGFDDDPTSALWRPPLTTLRQPVDEIATCIVDLLLAQLENRPVATRQVLLAPSLIVRASSDPAVSPEN